MRFLKMTALMILAAALNQAAAQATREHDTEFDPADPTSCIFARTATVLPKDAKPPTTAFYSCDGGSTLHAVVQWPKGYENDAQPHGIVSNYEQAKLLTKSSLEEQYGKIIENLQPCPGGGKEKGLLREDKSGWPFIEVCGNVWSRGDNLYLSRDSKEARIFLAEFEKLKKKSR